MIFDITNFKITEEMALEFFKTFIPHFSFNTIYFFATFVLVYFAHRIFTNRFVKLDGKGVVTKELLHKAFKPIYILIGLLYIISIVTIACKIYPDSITSKNILINVDKIKNILITLILSISAMRFIKGAHKNYLTNVPSINIEQEQTKVMDPSKADIIAKMLSIITLAVATFSIMHSCGISLAAIGAIGGFSGLMLGFATKDLFSNFFGLFSIYMDRPFAVGDKINITDKNIKGVIEEIGLRITTIRTDDHTSIYLPNSIFNTSIIENLSRITNKVFKHEVIVTHKHNIPEVEKIAENIKESIIKMEKGKIIAKPRIDIFNINDKTLSIRFTINTQNLNDIDFNTNNTEILKIIFNEFNNANFEIV